MLQAEKPTINFTGIEIRTEPFCYFLMPKVFESEESLLLLKWLETDAPWKLIRADFYTQYEFNFEDVELPKQIDFLNKKYFTNYIIKQLEDLFLTKLESRIDLTAHKLVAGHTIRLHNDFIPGRETHRLIIQLNRNWQVENGGLLLFFNSTAAEDIHRIICPVHNSAVGFAISPKSNHAVSTVYDSERYTLVYSFYAADQAV